MNIYLHDEGKLIYDNGIKYIVDNEVLTIPQFTTKNIIILSKNITIDSNLILKLNCYKINLFIFDSNKNNYSLLANNHSNGINTILESKCYLNDNIRLYISKELLNSAFNNMLKVLSYYDINDDVITKYINKVDDIENSNDLLILEAKIRKRYYSHFNEIINNIDFIFKKRVFHPATDLINALISFGNSLLYKECLINIFETNLNPKISYLHSANERLTSLEYDISEIYKPIIVDRTIFTCINKKIITKDDFIINENGVFLKTDAKNKLIEKYHNKLKSSVLINNRRLSYNSLIKSDCINLKKFVCNKIDKLDFFKSKW